MLQLWFAVGREARTCAVLFSLQERAPPSLALLQPEVMPPPRNHGKCNFCCFPAPGSPSSVMPTVAVFACTRDDLVAPLTSLDFPTADMLEEPWCGAEPDLPALPSSRALKVPLIVVSGDTPAVLGTHPPPLRSREGVEMLIFATPHSECFSLVASPERLGTKIHFLFRKRAKISPEVQPPALATSSINSLRSRVLLLFVPVAFSL